MRVQFLKNIYFQETCSAIKGSGRKIDENIKTGLKWMCATLDHNWNVYHPRVDGDMKEEAERKQKEMSEKRERVRKMREERYSCHETYLKTYLIIDAACVYYHLNCEFKPRSWRGVLDTTLCDKVYQ